MWDEEYIETEMDKDELEKYLEITDACREHLECYFGWDELEKEGIRFNICFNTEIIQISEEEYNEVN